MQYRAIIDIIFTLTFSDERSGCQLSQGSLQAAGPLS